MRPFLVCIHDATPAYARETRVMIRDLALSWLIIHPRLPLARNLRCGEARRAARIAPGMYGCCGAE